MDKNITPRNEKYQRHGYWERYWGYSLWFKRYYINDKENGYEEYYMYKHFELIFHI